MLEPTAAFMGEEAGIHPTQVTSLSQDTHSLTPSLPEIPINSPPEPVVKVLMEKMIERTLWKSQVAEQQRHRQQHKHTHTHRVREKEGAREDEREGGRICLITSPTLTDGCSLPKEQRN